MLLHIEGKVSGKGRWNEDDLANLSAPFQVEDVSRIAPGFSGRGVWVRAILAEAGPDPQADHVTFLSKEGHSAENLSLREVMERGILVYQQSGASLPKEKGGPLRFILPGGEGCDNVKGVHRVEVTIGKKAAIDAAADHGHPHTHGDPAS